MMTAAETLERARFARGIGDVPGCLHISEAAIRQADFEHDWTTAYWGAEVPGRMYMGRGEPQLAIPHYRHALDIALMHDLKDRIGGAYHDIALAEREAGNRDEYRHLAGAAFSHYYESDPRDPCLTGLMADSATTRFEASPNCPELARAALEAWRCVPACMRTHRYKLAAAAQQMMLSAAVGLVGRYRAAKDALDLFVATATDGEAVALSLAYAAQGALRAMEFETAASLAERAERIAVDRDEPVIGEQAREVRIAALAEQAGARS